MNIENVIKILEKSEKTELIKLIREICKDRKVEDIVLEYCKNNIPESRDFIIDRKFESIWRELYGYLIDYDEEDYLEEDDFYDDNDYYDSGYGIKFESEIYEGIGKIRDYIKKYNVSPEIRKKTVEEMLVFLSDHFFEFNDWLEEIAELLCTSREEKKYMADFIMEKALNDKEWAVRIYLEIEEYEKFLEIRKKDMRYTQHYVQLLNYYDSQKEYRKALDTAIKGIEKGDGEIQELFSYIFNYYSKDSDTEALESIYNKILEKREGYAAEIFTVNEMMYNYYSKNNNYEKKREMLLSLMNLCDKEETYMWYKEVEKGLSNEDFEKEEASILKRIKERNFKAYLDICLDKGETEEVLENILKLDLKRSEMYGYLDKDHYFSNRLSLVYPREIIDLYWKEAEFWADLKDVGHYSQSASILKKIMEISEKNGLKEEWTKAYSEFMEKHRRKRNLMKEIKEEIPEINK